MLHFDPRLYLVTDPDLLGQRSLLELVQQVVAAGVTAVQLRHKEASDRELVQLAQALKAALEPRGVALLLNDRVDLAHMLGVGVHVGQSDTPPAEAREILGPEAIIGLSVEFLDDPIDKAASYIAASPVFSSATKADSAPELGLAGLARLRRRTELPLVAIGGIHEGNVAQVIEAGADGIAVVSAILGVSDPVRAARRLRAAIDTAKGLEAPPPPPEISNVLSIGGCDSAALSGIQSDLKTFAALGVYGANVVTALTARNTRVTLQNHLVPPDFVRAQLEALFSDIDFGAVKIGALGQAATIQAVASALERHRPPHVVLDPIMDSAAGVPPLPPEALRLLRRRLLPHVTAICPTVQEAAALLESPAPTQDSDLEGFAQELLSLGPGAALLQAQDKDSGHPVEILATTRGAPQRLRRDHVTTAYARGAGSTLAAAWAARLAQGVPARQAAQEALDYLTGALLTAEQLQVGQGQGPLHHLHALWTRHT